MRKLSAGETEILESLVDDCGLQNVAQAFGVVCAFKAEQIENNSLSRKWNAAAFQFNRLGREAERNGM
jgi:hypothetical protein